MKRKALRVRSEGSIPPYVTKAEPRKQHSDSPLCNSLYLNIHNTSHSLVQPSLEAKVRTDRLYGASLYHRGQGI